MGNSVINCVLVETPKRDRTFNLLHGDIFQTAAEAIVLNRYKGDEGALVQQLKELYPSYEEQPFFNGVLGFQASFVNANNLPYDVYIIDLPYSEFEPIDANAYKQTIQQLFSMLQVLEVLGKQYRAVALPVLFRNSIESIHDEAVEILILQATSWLKKSQSTESIKFVLYHEKDAELWSQKMNEVLGRQAFSSEQVVDLDMFRRKVYGTLQRMPRTVLHYDDTIFPLMQALNRPTFQIETVAAFSRKLLESYCVQLLKNNDKPFTNLDSALRQLNGYSLHPVTIQNLYQIKGFGNAAVHKLDDIKFHVPFEVEDAIVLFICLLQLIQLYEQLLKEVTS